MNKWLNKIIINLIKTYQVVLSPLMGKQCRFYPSCSHYCIEAYQRFGFVKASLLTIKRISKCHPWHKGGIDLLPEKQSPICKQ